MRLRLLAASAAILVLGGGAANAAAIAGLYSTGVDASGAVLANGATDSHYVLNTGASPVVYSNPAYVGSPTAAFIAVQSDGGYGFPVNTYNLVFNLNGDPNTASITGQFEADNYASVFLNGLLVGQDDQDTVYSNFESETPLDITSGFLPGRNTLAFLVTDTGPPSALEVSNLAGTVSAAPEPAAWALMFVGIGGLGLMLRRAKSTLGSKMKGAFAA